MRKEFKNLTLNNDQLGDLALELRENAVDLVEDARFLLDAGRHPRAHAFAVLAFEEMGKLCMCLSGLMGLTSSSEPSPARHGPLSWPGSTSCVASASTAGPRPQTDMVLLSGTISPREDPMPEPSERDEPRVSAGPSRAVDLDYSTLRRLVEAEAKHLHEIIGLVHHELEDLCSSQDRTLAGEVRDDEPDALHSRNELIARLDGIGQSAHGLARHLQVLLELRVIGDKDASRRTDTGVERADVGAPIPATSALKPSPSRGGAVDLPPFLTPKEAAAHLRVSVWAVYDAVNAGALHAIRVGRAIRIPRDALAPKTTADPTDE